MAVLTANELKRGGVSGIERAMLDSNDHQVMIDVRGKTKYVVLDVEQYNLFREYELDKAIAEAQACLAAGEVLPITNFDSFSAQLKADINNA